MTLAEHLSAQKLVSKLDGKKSKGRAAILETLVPYPALVHTHADGNVKVHLLDFEDLHVTGATRDEALRSAADALMRQLLTRMKEDRPLPAPDAYLDLIDEDRVVMVDPLSIES